MEEKHKIVPVVDIDLNNIFFQLHTTALKEVETNWKNKIDIVNLGIDYKNQTFVGSGEFIIVAQHNKNDTSLSPKQEPQKFKDDCKDALTTYCQIFAGQYAKMQLEKNDDLLKPIIDVAPVPENIATLSLSQLLIEKSDNDNDRKNANIGYYVKYNINIEGQKKHNVYDALTKGSKYLTKHVFNGLKNVISAAATGLFSNVFKDLQSLKIIIGGKDYNAGGPVANTLKAVADGVKKSAVVAGQSFKKAISKTDLQDLSNKFEEKIRAKFTRSTANASIYNVDSLLIQIKKQKKLTSELTHALMKNGIVFRMQYVIGLTVANTDENYEQINVDVLHKIFKDALSDVKGAIFKTTTLFKEFPKENVLKIDGFKSKVGVNKLRAKSVPIEALQIKQQFMKLMLENYLLVSEETDVNKLKEEITYLFRSDPSDNNSSLDKRKLMQLASEINQLDDDEFSALSTEKYDTKEKLVEALTKASINSNDAAYFIKIIDAFVAQNNLERLYNIIKTLFNSSDERSADTTESDLYIFCLPNVVAQKDEKVNNKKEN